MACRVLWSCSIHKTKGDPSCHLSVSTTAPPSGKEPPCYENCTLAYEQAQAEIDRAIYLRTIECSMLGAQSALVSSFSGNLIFAAGAGFVASTTCSWFGWLEIDLMQQDASQALADCRMVCLAEQLGLRD